MDADRTKWAVLLTGGALYSALAAFVVLTTLNATPLVFPFTPPTGDREVIGELADVSRVCQTFTARYDGLSRVEVAMFDYGRRNAGPFEFHLRSAPDAPDIVILVRQASKVKDGRYHSFTFSPIRNSKGRQFCFCLQAPRAELNKAVSAWGFTDDVYPWGAATFRSMWGERVGVRDLDFRLGYHPTMATRVEVLFRRLARLLPTPELYIALPAAWWVMLCLWLARLAMRVGRR